MRGAARKVSTCYVCRSEIPIAISDTRADGEAVRVGNRPEMLLSGSVRIITRFPHDLNPTV
jgi:hypothetical protein